VRSANDERDKKADDASKASEDLEKEKVNHIEHVRKVKEGLGKEIAEQKKENEGLKKKIEVSLP